jgi:hypothetical protein
MEPSRNLWNVRMEHNKFQSLLILAPDSIKAARKAITFTKRNDKVKQPVVTEVKFGGTIDAF